MKMDIKICNISNLKKGGKKWDYQQVKAECSY